MLVDYFRLDGDMALEVFTSSEYLRKFCGVKLGLNLNYKLNKHDPFYISMILKALMLRLFFC